MKLHEESPIELEEGCFYQIVYTTSLVCQKCSLSGVLATDNLFKPGGVRIVEPGAIMLFMGFRSLTLSSGEPVPLYGKKGAPIFLFGDEYVHFDYKWVFLRKCIL